MLSHPRQHQALLMLICGSIAAIGTVFGFVMQDAHRSVSRDVAASASNLAAAVAHDVDRDIEMLDLSLQAVADAWGKPAVQALDPQMRSLLLFDRSATAQGVGMITVLDQEGMVRAISRGAAIPTVSFADRDYFRVHMANASIGLFVSRPFVDRITGVPAIGLSRRIANADGGFGGVVVVTLQIPYLNKLYHGLDLGPDGTVTLFRTDGTVITREPSAAEAVGRNVRNDSGFNPIRTARLGTFEGPSPVDGKPRIISFHRVGNLPLIQDIEVSADRAYADWWRKAMIMGAIMGLLCLTSFALLLMLQIELTRRVAVEATLEHLASTDPLTGLANRRRFEAMMEAEWQRAQRTGSSLAVLMIDADRFKAFNDTFGHPAGDALLRQLADCVARYARGAGGLAARYGGEEFVVLLPHASADGALQVAEAMRAAVLELDGPVGKAPGARATVSIGVASGRAVSGGAPSGLMTMADTALYKAKQAGRDRCEVADPVAQEPARLAA